MAPGTWIRNTLIAASVAVLPTVSVAGGVPTIDTQNLLQELKIYEQMLKDAGVQADHLSKLIEQVELLEEQLARLEEIKALNEIGVVGIQKLVDELRRLDRHAIAGQQV